MLESYIKYAYVESMVYYKRNKKKVSAREKKIKYHSGSSAFLIKSSIKYHSPMKSEWWIHNKM